VPVVQAQLKRLATSGLAYQAAGLLSAFLALFTLPLYTRHLSTADFGYAETLLTLVILSSILLRAGLGEALIRHWFDTEDDAAREALARTTTAIVLASSTIALVAGVALAGPLSRLILGTRDATLMAFGVFGIWAFTNLEVAYTLLRVQERRRAYLAASATNVLLTVTLTVVLVVVRDEGARGYVLGNYAASAVVLLGVWVFALRDHIGVPRAPVALAPLLRYGGPTIAADSAVFLLNVVDRTYLLRAESPAAAGLYSVAVKLATGVIVAVRGFQLAWPPLAYSVTDDDQARALYARVTTSYLVVTGVLVCALELLGRWVVRLLAAPDFFGAYEALPWLGLGWALYGLYLVLVTIAGRVKATIRTLPAALAGVVVNVVVLVLLVPPLGIEGAAIALCAAYVAMLGALHLMTRRLFVVPFEWAKVARLVVVAGGIAVVGNLVLPDSGAGGLLARSAALAVIPAALVLAGVVTRGELRALRQSLGPPRL
jgi:O-antigen/teichoic acid export membrane protein